MAVLASLVGFCHLVEGFSNRQLVQHTTALLDAPLRNSTSHLRSALAQMQGTHPENASQPSLPADAARSQSGGALYQDLLASPGSRFDLARSENLPDHLKRRSLLATARRQLSGTLDDFTNRQLLAA